MVMSRASLPVMPAIEMVVVAMVSGKDRTCGILVVLGSVEMKDMCYLNKEEPAGLNI